MYLLRAFIVWLVMMFAESIHGTLRQLFLASAVGDFRARQVSVFTGMMLIFGIAFLFIRWIHVEAVNSLLAVGLLWTLLTLFFEFGLGVFVLNFSWERMLEDYDISRGGLMGFGLLFMLVTPLLASRLRNKFPAKQTA